MAIRGNINLDQLRIEDPPNDASQYLDSTGNWSTPSGGGSGSFFGLWDFVAPPSSGWSWDNQASATITSATGYEYLSCPRTGNIHLHLRYRTAPSTPYTITAAIFADLSSIQSRSGATDVNCGFGIGFRESSTGKIVNYLFVTDTAVGAYGAYFGKWTNATTLSANYSGHAGFRTMAGLVLARPALLRITDDGTNLKCYWSMDGVVWTQFDSRARTDFMSGGPDQVWFGAYANGDGVEAMLRHWDIS